MRNVGHTMYSAIYFVTVQRFSAIEHQNSLCTVKFNGKCQRIFVLNVSTCGDGRWVAAASKRILVKKKIQKLFDKDVL